MRRQRTALAVATAGAALALVAAPASAGPREPISGHDPFVIATCAGGEEVVAGVVGWVNNSRDLVDPDGNVTGTVINISYRLSSTLSSTGEVFWSKGTARIALDFLDGSVTETGNSRTLALPGQGWVIKSAGRSISDLNTGTVVWKAGPADSEDASLLCGLFGLEAE